MAITVFLFVYLFLCSAGEAETVRGDLSERFPEPEKVVWEGTTYRKRDDLQTILLIGVDTTAKQESLRVGYQWGGQSDFLLLLVIDKANQRVTPVHLDRDTMTDITVLSALGVDLGKYTLQICLAHGYGDGGKQSCEFTCEAVSGLLDTDIDYYMAMNLDAIPILNDAVGGVTVTIPTDMTSLDPTMTEGTTMTLHGPQAAYFVRYRMGIGSGTNAERMLRQRAYISAFADIVQEQVKADKQYIGKLFDEIEPMLVTDMRRGTMINMAWAARDYERVSTQAMEGEHIIGKDGFVEFHPDEDALTWLKLSLFYEAEREPGTP